ncbi:MAG: cell division protein FtsA, partial [Desulfatiglandales bacterium]
MGLTKRGKIVVGLDIGTTKICTLVGEMRPEGVKIIGVGIHPSEGLRKGVVIDLDGTVNSIRRSVEQAEKGAGIRITSVVTGIAGGHIKSFNTSANLSIRSFEVTERDVERVQEMARSVAVPMDREVIGTEIQEYCLDEQTGIKDPVGMSGKNLTVYMHVVTAAVASAQNLIKAANIAGLDVEDIVLQPLASGKAVLAEEEKEMGVALADFGGGTTDLALYYGGTVRHTSVLPLGGDNLTYDLAVGLRVSKNEAERLKREHGICHKGYLEKKTVEIADIGGWERKEVTSERILEVLEPRVTEIFSLLFEELEERHLKPYINMGFVLTGGSSVLPGMLEKAGEIFKVPVRIGYPKGILGSESVASP